MSWGSCGHVRKRPTHFLQVWLSTRSAQQLLKGCEGARGHDLFDVVLIAGADVAEDAKSRDADVVILHKQTIGDGFELEMLKYFGGFCRSDVCDVGYGPQDVSDCFVVAHVKQLVHPRIQCSYLQAISCSALPDPISVLAVLDTGP